MGFQGYYVKNMGNNKVFPTSLLKDGGEGYHGTPDIVSDKNDYTDGNGLTHRFPLPHTKSKLFLNTVDEVSETDKLVIQDVLSNDILMNLQYWNDKTHTYKTGNFYMPEIDWKHSKVNKKTYEITYAGVAITLIEY